MERNPFFTKERALFYYEKIEYYYKNQAYGQALAEIEKNKDLLGAVLNVGKQLSLNKIVVNSVVNFMLDIFEVDGNTEQFDEYFNKYRTTLELHTEPGTYVILHTYFIEKSKNQNLGSKDVRICHRVEDIIGEYVNIVKTPSSGPKQKDSRAKSIEEDFLSSIGTPYMAPASMKAAVKTEDELIYGSKDDFKSAPSIELTVKEKEALLTDSSVIFDEESSSLQDRKPEVQASVIAKELELQNELANKVTSEVQLKSKEKKTSINNKNKGPGPQYVKNHTINKSGGKITELEFENTHSPKAGKRSSDSKKTRKKKPSKMPLITATITLVLILAAFGIFKSGIFNKPETASYTPAITDSNPEINNEEVTASADSTNNLDTADGTTDSNTDATETADTTDNEYILPSDTTILTLDDLEGMDKSEIRFAINEMYARKGWNFDNGGDYFTYFSEKSWYKPDPQLQTPSDASAKFSETENVNLATIIKYRDTLN